MTQTGTATAAQYRIRQINGQESGCSYTVDRRSQDITEGQINEMREQWTREMRADIEFDSDWIIVVKIDAKKA